MTESGAMLKKKKGELQNIRKLFHKFLNIPNKD